MTSNTGRWASMMRSKHQPYGPTLTYRLGRDFLAGMPLIEDWGCGRGYFRNLVAPERYRGIDGTEGALVDEVVDLVTYRSQVPSIFMRHVIEHNWEWAAILSNAMASFERRFFLVLFTPLTDGPTIDIAKRSFLKGVPDLSLNRQQLLDLTTGVDREIEMVATPHSQYGTECVLRMTRP